MAMFIVTQSRAKTAEDSEDTESIETNTKKKCLEQGFTEHDLCPFKLQWSFGLNPEAPVINLTTVNRALLAYACSHVVMIYDYSSRKMLPLLGHRNAVRMLSTSRDGKWLLTADSGKDSVVVVWDTEKGIPVCTLFNSQGNEDITAAGISPNAKEIVTCHHVGDKQDVHFWLWAYGKDKSDASISLVGITSERVKEITFNDECPEQFALTTDYHVLFLTWNGHALSCNCPTIMTKFQRIGILNMSCYVSKMQQLFTASTNGCILVWENVSCDDEHATDDTNFAKKKHLKTVNLQKSSITVITDNEGMLVTGNSNGRVTFYDYQLRLLYWCQSCDLDSIRWISFDLQSTNLLTPVFAIDVSENDHQDNTKVETILSRLTIELNAEHFPQNYKNNKFTASNETISNSLPTDATLQCFPFNVQNFFACSSTGIIALIEIRKQKCHLVTRHSIAITTSMDTHPESNYVVVGDAQGTVRLYNHEQRTLLISRNIPPLPDYQPILERQITDKNIVYVTCPQSQESLKAVTALKFSPRCDMLVCGLENGAIWILHHITLDPIDEIPYKHSSMAVNKIAFTQCAEYMAYADALTVIVLKRNNTISSEERNIWNLIGKYHSHYLPIRNILFGSAASDSDVPRFFSLGEDQELVEYDLAHSGPYPAPGLQILHIDRIEQSAIPLCLAWYSKFDSEKFLVVSNSEYKYKLFSDATKMIRGTYLGPTFEKPVQHFQILMDNLVDHNDYMVFATDREIGLQLMPLDGNPYKVVGMTGHPQKILGISVSNNKEMLFTAGYNDPCVLMWTIKRRSVDIMAQLGGEGLSPFYCHIEGGKKGWLANEMKDFFHYAQILQQGENVTADKTASDNVVIEQIPDLMRAIGYFPTNKEIENIMTEVRYKHYVETGKLVEKITFEEFVQLYVNHRPTFGLCMRHIKEAFHTFIEENSVSIENPTLTREQFMDILLGGTISKKLMEDDKLISESLTLQEAYKYLKTLVSPKDEVVEIQLSPSQRSMSFNFRFLPPVITAYAKISYKDFAMDIMGVELLEEIMADN